MIKLGIIRRSPAGASLARGGSRSIMMIERTGMGAWIIPGADSGGGIHCLFILRKKMWLRRQKRSLGIAVVRTIPRRGPEVFVRLFRRIVIVLIALIDFSG
jgi:hypothetical protein